MSHARSAIETLPVAEQSSPQPASDAPCPLCGASSRIVDRLPVAQLRERYRQRFGLSVDAVTDGLDRLEFRQCEDCTLRFFHPFCPADGDFYARLAAWFRDKRASPPDKSEFVVGTRHVRPGDAVLDVGCGRGPFAARIPHATRYVGLEINPEAIAANDRDIRPESLSEHALAHRGEYDVVCSFQVLEHVVDPMTFLDQCLACLKPGGTLIISVPNADGFMGAERDNILNMPPHHLTWWSRRNVESIADILDLDTVEIVEEPLAEAHRKAFLKMLAMNVWRGRGDASPRFFIGGKTYWLEDLLSRASARLLLRAVAGVEFAIRGHSITGVYRKNRAA